MKRLIPVAFRPVIKRFVLRLWFYGNANRCPVCSSDVKLWKPLGYDFPVINEKQIVGSGIRNAQCPVCGSSDRVRLLFMFLKSKTSLFTHRNKLLHIAPEDSLRDIFLRLPNLGYLTADIDPGKVMEQMDITLIGHTGNSFDAILCNHVLEHIPEDTKAMGELLRVLKPGGWAILQVPVSKVLDKTFEDPAIISPAEKEKYFGQKDHVRIYGQDFSERLVNAGFLVQEFKWYNDDELQKKWRKYGLNPDETVFYCMKPS